MAITYALTAVGLVLLFAGGEFLVRGAVTVAKRLGLSPLLIGLTIVAGATSAPELLVSLRASFAGQPDIAVGNVVGSNIANIALVLGIGAAIRPFVFDRSDIRRDAWTLMGVSALVLPFAWMGVIPRWAGALFLVLLGAYILWSYRAQVPSLGDANPPWPAEEAAVFTGRAPLVVALLQVGTGVVALAVGADWLVSGVEVIAVQLGVPIAVVSLTVVALGTSLPEFATTIMALRKGHPDVAVGNVLGSCIFNILSILGLTALVQPIAISPRLATVDIPIMVTFAVIAGAALVRLGRVGRVMGICLLGGYALYLSTLL